MSIIVYLKNNNITSYPGGLPASMTRSGEKYDLPYSWPHFLHLIINGLNNTQIPIAKHLAYSIARQWIKAVHKSYKTDKTIHSSYDASKLGQSASNLQTSSKAVYGWTNGAFLDILYRYSDLLNHSNIIKNIAVFMLLPIIITHIY